MSVKNDKKTRRIAGKYKRRIADSVMREIMGYPFRTRLSFALMVLKGVKRGKAGQGPR
jgi:hypothetical protein